LACHAATSLPLGGLSALKTYSRPWRLLTVQEIKPPLMCTSFVLLLLHLHKGQIFSSAPWSQTPCLCSSLMAGDKVSCPLKIQPENLKIPISIQDLHI
jgi:hypothetical protein